MAPAEHERAEDGDDDDAAERLERIEAGGPRAPRRRSRGRRRPRARRRPGSARPRASPRTRPAASPPPSSRAAGPRLGVERAMVEDQLGARMEHVARVPSRRSRGSRRPSARTAGTPASSQKRIFCSSSPSSRRSPPARASSRDPLGDLDLEQPAELRRDDVGRRLLQPRGSSPRARRGRGGPRPRRRTRAPTRSRR